MSCTGGVRKEGCKKMWSGDGEEVRRVDVKHVSELTLRRMKSSGLPYGRRIVGRGYNSS